MKYTIINSVAAGFISGITNGIALENWRAMVVLAAIIFAFHFGRFAFKRELQADIQRQIQDAR